MAEKQRQLETSEATDTQRQVPIIVESNDSEADEDEMEDYYENHKAWPTGMLLLLFIL